jgi:hypothetical protein
MLRGMTKFKIIKPFDPNYVAPVPVPPPTRFIKYAPIGYKGATHTAPIVQQAFLLWAYVNNFSTNASCNTVGQYIEFRHEKKIYVIIDREKSDLTMYDGQTKPPTFMGSIYTMMDKWVTTARIGRPEI